MPIRIEKNAGLTAQEVLRAKTRAETLAKAGWISPEVKERLVGFLYEPKKKETLWLGEMFRSEAAINNIWKLHQKNPGMGPQLKNRFREDFDKALQLDLGRDDHRPGNNIPVGNPPGYWSRSQGNIFDTFNLNARNVEILAKSKEFLNLLGPKDLSLHTARLPPVK